MKFIDCRNLCPVDPNAQEIHASHVESTLLSQVRVAKVGQEIDVWVLGRTRVRLKVGEFCRVPLFQSLAFDLSTTHQSQSRP